MCSKSASIGEGYKEVHDHGCEVVCDGIRCATTLFCCMNNWWQLDIPNQPFLAFCNMGCLRSWVMWKSTHDN